MSIGRSGKTISVSWHEASGQFRKYVGSSLGQDGRPQPKCWYLGEDEAPAIQRAVELTAEWGRLKARGYRSWPSDGLPSVPPPVVPAPALVVSSSEITLLDAVKLYLGEVRDRVNAKRVSLRHYEACRHRLARVLDHLGRDRVLSQVDQTALNSLVNHLFSRPLVRPSKGQRHLPPRQISISTAVAIIKAAKTFFEWLGDHDRIDWAKPKRFRQIFMVKRRDMLTEAQKEREQHELVSNEVESFSRDQLRLLFEAADERARCWMLLGLNCGFTQKDLSDLRVFEVFLDAERPYIHRKRGKTGILGKWALWPETVEAMRRTTAPANSLNRIFLSDGGLPLVEGGSGGRDAVRLVWRRLRENVGDRQSVLPFKFLRKTGAQAVKKASGIEISEMYLCHAEPQTMNRFYANRTWDDLADALHEVRPSLSPVSSAQTSISSGMTSLAAEGECRGEAA